MHVPGIAVVSEEIVGRFERFQVASNQYSARKSINRVCTLKDIKFQNTF